ncbi:MAG TPA: peptidylprolyl isomerase [Pseudogracilibacillus sp.]|nr:peptidylprolyl isomerase [Pseudogracilibacillus sp.]
MNRAKKRMMFMFLIVLMLIIYGCQSDIENSNEPNNTTNNNDEEKPLVTMTMEDGGEIEIELYPNKAPNTVNNFIALIEDDFYDGLIFHRVIPDFMIQGGDPEGTGMGDPGYSIKGEFSSNDFDNDLKHEPGILSMARSQDPDSAGSQFFIVTGDGSHLDGDYAAFGKVIDGMDVVEDIEAEETDNNDRPKTDQIIESMSVDLNGYQAEEPEKSK